MTATEPGTVLITGPTRGLGRATTLALASRPDGERPDLLLVGRPGSALEDVAQAARARGATVQTIGCDLSRLADVRKAAAAARESLSSGAVRPLRALIANAGAMSADTRQASADGYELTFAVGYLAHAQLIADLRDVLSAPARVVMLGSNTYHANIYRRLMGVPAADWRDPVEMARPATAETKPGFKAGGVAYSNTKLAILYYAHELQRQVAPGVNVVVFEPGWMPGTDLGRGMPAAARAMGRGLGHLPGVATPKRSGPALASVALDAKWGQLRDGAFVVRDKVTEVKPIAQDREREGRLWEATEQLLLDSAHV
ncbi:NAD(P)-dependent dehydrogenase (short-subunit alcohol dehydrogenase family) [Catenulispora sp. EB89]|uniref:SDR family NAD(P)-dependent oxidoreductase n=1 Tax=Catenulispora sp. EB89 TaxID=3156257 RepID=UPI00351756FB